MRVLGLLVLAGIAAFSGCADTPYYKKRHLGRFIMQLNPSELEESYRNKVLGSREVSGGQPGNAAGGGCGCGN